MNGYLSQAYLDDYNQIKVTISKRLCNGVSDKFHLVYNDEIIELKVVSVNSKSDRVEYNLTYDGDIEISKPYDVMMVNGYTVPLVYRFIVKSDRFNEEFYYGGKDLGAVASPSITSFKLWAPTASSVLLCINDKVFKMNRKEQGTYALAFSGDLTGSVYHYIVSVNGETFETTDPYSKAVTANGKDSVVVALSPVKRVELPKINKRDSIIYELSVRDVTSDGTFVAMSEDLDYIEDLGITHVQLLPVNDFGSVNDYHKDLYYNWGYDPVNYQVLDGSYSSNPAEPLKVRDEFKQLVTNLHKRGIRVNLDVVFNHHYYAYRSNLNKCVPYYYYRYDEKGQLAEGTFCGSECDSALPMHRKFIIDTLKYYVNEFDIDGFRFDLMGFIDVETINEALKSLKVIKEDVMLYGEGWVMNAGCDKSKLAHYDNKDKLPEIGFFNDEFRDTIKGSTFSATSTGYGSGNSWLASKAKDVLLGNRFGDDPSRSINYAECHDNMTCYDKLCSCCINETKQQLIDRTKVILDCVLLAQGISFIHAGQEYCLSKKGLDNTYNGPEEVNKLTDEMKLGYKDVIEHTASIIYLKKKYHISNARKVDAEVVDGVIIYKVDSLTILINATTHEYTYKFDGSKVILCDKGTLKNEVVEDSVTVKALETLVLGSN